MQLTPDNLIGDYNTSGGSEHTPDNPYCSDITCFCHSSVEYHAQVTTLHSTSDEIAQAYDFFEVMR